MNRPVILRSTVIRTLCCLLFPLALAGQALPPAEQPPEEQVAVPDAVDEMFFLADQILTVSQATLDDIFAAGNEVVVRDTAADHLVVAAGDLTIESANVSDVIAAGGDITLQGGAIADDLILAGGSISVQPLQWSVTIADLRHRSSSSTYSALRRAQTASFPAASLAVSLLS